MKLAPFVQLVHDKINGLEFKRLVSLSTRHSSLFIIVTPKNGAFPLCSSDVIAFGFNPRGTDETWCIDTRGVLTLSIDRGTYQRLGLLGTPLPWKAHQDRYSTWTPFFSLFPL